MDLPIRVSTKEDYMKDETLDAIYSVLTTDQIDALETYDKQTRTDMLNCISELYNAGISLSHAIKLTFNAFREE